MLYSKSKSPEHPEEIRVSKVHFLAEQDGVPERELKSRLIEFFQQGQNVVKAYLVRVAYNKQSSMEVALGLRVQCAPDHRVAKKAGEIFAQMFGPREHLDIIFLSEEDESELVKVCSPFFERVSPTQAET